MAMQRTRYIIFVDANVLLDLYEKFDSEWLKVAQQLRRLGGSLLITQQVADEVVRTKAKVARDALRRAIADIKAPRANLPPGLRDHEDALRKACDQINKIKAGLEHEAHQHIFRVTLGSDDVSKALDEILESPVHHSPDQLERARQRKERGQPPGKPGGPLGDQLSWEQLLDAVGDATKIVWMVTRDEDFLAASLDEKRDRLLNPLLRAELSTKAFHAEVRVKSALAPAINDYLKEAGEAEAFTKEELAYLEFDDKHRKPWQCIRDGENTPIEGIQCVKCGDDDTSCIGEESYALVEHDNGAYAITLSPDDDRATPIACNECGGTAFYAEFASFCSRCDHVLSAD